MDPSLVLDKLPKLLDLNTENITENVHQINSNNPDRRLKFVVERLVHHLHEFAREARLSTDEWMAGIEFLTEIGKICDNERQEMVLLSDTLGLSLLVDSIDHPKPAGSTEGTVLGPFHTHNLPEKGNGDEIMLNDPNGMPMLVVCTVKDVNRRPIEGVKIEIWETDSTGNYDVQRSDHTIPDGRCSMKSDHDGVFWFKGVLPVSYPIPHDGPVGKMLKVLGRHPMRPAHIHFILDHPRYDRLVTALYLRGDPYETSDAVFGVKSSLLIDVDHTDQVLSERYGVAIGTKVIKYDFTLVSEQESLELRAKNSRQELEKLGHRVEIVNGLPCRM
ncbi:catechol dioxygenase [Talaromyces proteolyticus]|uniref:Catechol dioxygenase n=1 Tax=Talaromyces proteolyticus TaxID=1131652 RepID=A0AAD4KT20_9EURO|nr:catechol dioxygenase [Talaromyces proteolyticus]KAH8698716.1 catechol dioxygenase [Talaromyces proteolyticus]